MSYSLTNKEQVEKFVSSFRRQASAVVKIDFSKFTTYSEEKAALEEYLKDVFLLDPERWSKEDLEYGLSLW